MEYANVDWDENSQSMRGNEYSFQVGNDFESTLDTFMKIRQECNVLSMNLDENIHKMNAVEFCTVFKQKKEEYIMLQKDIFDTEEKQKMVDDAVKRIDTALRELDMPYEDSFEIVKKLKHHREEKTKALNIDGKMANLQKLRSYIDVMIQLMKEMKEELGDDEIKEDGKCSICLEKKVAYAVVPCGHTTCGDCKARLKRQCFVCRGVVEKAIRFYI